jgi:hypothetical protein
MGQQRGYRFIFRSQLPTWTRDAATGTLVRSYEVDRTQGYGAAVPV